MVTGSIDIKGITMLTDTFGYAEIRGMDAVFLTAFEIVVDVEFQVFVLGGGLDLNETVMRGGDDFLAYFTMYVPAAGMSFELLFRHPFMTVLVSVHEMTHTGRSIATVRFQMILVTFHIFKISMTLRTFSRDPIRSTRGSGQTKGATMRAGSTMIFDMAISNITVVALVFMFCHTWHGEDSVIMSIVE
jgi:hypothetical protein